MNLHKQVVFATTIALFGHVLSDSNCTMSNLTDSQGNCIEDYMTTTTQSTTTLRTDDTIGLTSTTEDDSIIIQKMFNSYSVLPARTILPDDVAFEVVEEEMVDEMIKFVTCPQGILDKNGTCILDDINVIDAEEQTSTTTESSLTNETLNIWTNILD